MDIAAHDSHAAAPVGEDLLVCFNGQRVLRRVADGEFIIGREVPPSHVQIDHPGISRLHVRLLPGARWELIDYDSRNGVYVHGRRIEHETPITDGMTVHLGAPDGIPVSFHYIGAEQHTPIQLDPNIQRTGQAVVERYEELGLSPRNLHRDNIIDQEALTELISGRRWPDQATRAALEVALAWPAGTLDAIREGQPHGEITDVITPTVGRTLLVDSATLALADIDAAMAELPPATDPCFAARAEPVRRRLAELQKSLAAATGDEVVEMVDTIARVYARLLMRIAMQ
ncbi:FHA domain-containing protein [Mycobacterium sp.]|uniref:FHA domain-containing protein n=1 Tax=Mycobacterium sp. TaxID=1785 RepID=UPI002D995D96|nr:FHA domain-containing protein [Mycobacterium sp.]